MIKTKKATEVELTPKTQFDMLSKKIVCMFYRNALFARLSIIDYEGIILGQGDAVRMVDHEILRADRALVINEKRNLAIFKDMFVLDLAATRIAKNIQEEVEKAIVKDDNGGQAHYHRSDSPRLYFVGQVVPRGGFEAHPGKYHNMKFVYGFKIK